MVVLVLILAVILAFVLGIAVIGLAFKLFWLAVIGLVLGALARLVIPGRQNVGLLATSLCGIGGSLIGGVIADALDWGSILGFLLAIAVAVGLILLVESSQRGSAA